MRQKINKIGFNLYFWVKKTLKYRSSLKWLKIYLSSLKQGLNAFHQTKRGWQNQLEDINDPRIKKLQKQVKGLHQLLPKNPLFSFSILLWIDEPNPYFLETCLNSIADQKIDACEVLIGYSQKQSSQVDQLIKTKHKELSIREWTCENERNADSILNALAKEAKNNYLFIMAQEDWLRPDLLFRFEQTLRLLKNPENSILSCNENYLSKKNKFILGSEIYKPEKMHFPYFFEQISEKGWLIPKELWMKVGGLRPEFKGAEYEDLLLRLEANGAHFEHLPFALYSTRMDSKKSSQSLTSFQKALTHYAQLKKLDWNYQVDESAQKILAIPQFDEKHSVQVVIPFKEQKKVTLSCVQHVLAQKEINFKITAIDNGSQDSSIAKEIEQLGGEVLNVNEPFNYSRLNNLAIQETKIAQACDLILFLNNDVDLEPDALLEMVRWMEQPQVGLVGCQLRYPNGLLQHGGVKVFQDASPYMQWQHEEIFYPIDNTLLASKVRICDGLTAACVLIKKKDFLKIKGFDETWFPIAYSDTNLVEKIKNQGLLCLYTPYAKGTHHESLSRGQAIEDYEASWWLHDLVNKNNGFN